MYGYSTDTYYKLIEENLIREGLLTGMTYVRMA